MASWRYQRGSRSLSINIHGVAVEGDGNTEIKGEDDYDDEEVASEIEEVIDSLLQGLKDKDTIVRYVVSSFLPPGVILSLAWLSTYV